MPLSLQVRTLVRRRLEDGEWRLGERLPTLEEFMAHYGVSRATMRAAMDELEKDGIIQRGRGRGTFVTGDLTQERWLILPTTWQGLVEHIERLHARVTSLASGFGSPQLAPDEGTLAASYWYACRVNWTEQIPYSVTSIYLDRELYERHPAEFKKNPVLPILERRFPSLLAQASQVLTITAADSEIAQHLQLSIGAPVAHVRRAVRSPQGRVVYLAQVQYPAKHLRIETTMKRGRSQRAAATASRNPTFMSMPLQEHADHTGDKP
jgi:GntR family transcriptional regulator